MTDRLDHEIARTAAEHYGLFAAHQLVDLGVTPEERRHRLATGRWEQVHDSVYRVAGAPQSWHASVLAACWAGGTRAVASHRSAAALYDLPGGSRDLVEITCPRWRRARHDGLVVHESLALEAEDVTLAQGIPCTTVERTLFDSAGRGQQRARVLDIMLDAALRREVTSLAALHAQAQRLATRGRPGSAQFKAALAERSPADVLPESPPERLLAAALVREGLPPPTLQYVVRDADGSFVARVDLAYPEQKIAIEYDSFQEHTGKLALVRDSARRNAVAALGFTTLTATAADLADRGVSLARAVRRIRERAASRPEPASPAWGLTPSADAGSFV